MIAIELGRRAIPAYVRPSFDEMEKNCKNKTAEAPAQRPQPKEESERMGAKAQPIIVIKRKVLTAAITAAHGRWPMLIS